MDEFEYGIVMRGYEDEELHRGPWSLEECEDWMQSARDGFPDGAKVDEVWWIVQRPVGKWVKRNGS